MTGQGRHGAALPLLAVLLVGCFDGNGPSTGPTPSRAPEPTAITTIYEIGATAWYEGLVLSFDRATASLDARGGPVTVLLVVENPGDEPSELNGPIRLVVGGTRFEVTRDSKVASVPGQGKVGAALTWELQGVASVDDAVIEIGELPEHVARIPLRPGADGTVALEPVVLEFSGSANAAGAKISLRGGLLRWDLPDWSQELAAELQALTLTYDVTYAGDFAGGFAFTGENVALRLPDGTVVSPRRDGHSQSVELIGARKTKKNLFSRFEIPAGMIGEFALLVRNGGTEKAIPFTIGG